MADRFVPNNAEIKKMLKGRDGLVWKRVIVLSQQVKNVARELAPVDQGALRGSIEYEVKNEDGPTGYVGSNLEYAIYVHEGTGVYAKKNPKPIRPKTKAFLAWPVKNQSGKGRRRFKGGQTSNYAYAKSVKGSPGRPFLKNALKRVLG